MITLYLTLMMASGLACGYWTLRYWYIAAKYGSTFAQVEDNGVLIIVIGSTVICCLVCHLFITIYANYNHLVETSLQLQAVADGCLNKGGE